MKAESLHESHENVCAQLYDLVRCIREFQLGDYSPLMDEIFDSEEALRLAHPWRDQPPPLNLIALAKGCGQ